MSTGPFLDLRHVRKSFGQFVALQDINLEVRQGEFICFLGPSGCGKTTLLRIIAGLEVQTSGQLFQAGRDISVLPPAQRDYGIVFQSYALFPNLSIADNVAYGLVNRARPKGEIATKVADLLKLVGLPGSQAKFPGQLSGGQQQRIALARALATSPSLLLLDEPLSALDALERVRLRQEIRSLQQKLGVTTIMVTHDQEEALSVADRIVVMNHGVIEQVGTPMAVYREPATPFVADFVGKVNVLHAQRRDGHVHFGELKLTHSGPDQSVKLYLRPEDVRPQLVGGNDPHEFEATIRHIDFLGSYCHVHVAAAAIGAPALVVYMSLNYLAEQALEVGSSVRLKLSPDRVRIF